MKNNHWIRNSFFGVILAIFGLASCCHEEEVRNPLWGHWGCERYISCRTNADGTERWDTLYYQVGAGHGYEFWFREDGSGKFKMNDSPALIKELSVDYELDEEQSQIVIHASMLFFFLYGSQFFDENEARFDIIQLNDSVLNVSWTNTVSETQSFYENFYLKKILN